MLILYRRHEHALENLPAFPPQMDDDMIRTPVHGIRIVIFRRTGRKTLNPMNRQHMLSQDADQRMIAHAHHAIVIARRQSD
ncbi:hypothetical protein AC781_12610 [Akkermansia glycaniphila]|nr:hypothetical protein AC781_12610 [Akkermansia glycaniphila]